MDINILDQTEFQTRGVVDFFRTTTLIMRSKSTGAAVKKKSTAQFREVPTPIPTTM